MPSVFGRTIDLKRAVGKTKTRSQMLLMVTDDGRLVEREVPVLSSCAVDEETCSGFLLDGPNQYQHERNGFWYQVVTEKSNVPICLVNPIDLKEVIAPKKEDKTPALSKMTLLLDGIHHRAWTMDLANLDLIAAAERRHSMLYLSLVIIVCIVGLILAKTLF